MIRAVDQGGVVAVVGCGEQNCSGIKHILSASCAKVGVHHIKSPKAATNLLTSRIEATHLSK
jgi:hypothetical protein